MAFEMGVSPMLIVAVPFADNAIQVSNVQAMRTA
jgi:hypothetical protein